MAYSPGNTPAKRTYSLSLDGNGITLRRDMPESVASAIIAIVMGDGSDL
jgi:hypothetical protein